MFIVLRQLRLWMLWLMLFVVTTVSADEPFSHLQWSELLSRHVRLINQGVASQVDYAGMQADQVSLNKYLDKLTRVEPKDFNAWNKQDQLAFLINAYNAWTVQLVLTQYPNLTSIKDLGTFFQSPWSKSFIPLLGETRSLDDIEHNLIRGSGRYNEPRIHFAVNCASIGCPALRPNAFVGNKLDAQLERATNLFLQDRSRNYLSNEYLYVSKVFKWYREDFEQGWRSAQNLPQFLAYYQQALGLSPVQTQALLSGQLDIEYADYDWRLNRTP